MCPQPAVTQTVPGGKRSSRDGRHTTLTLSFRRTRLANFTSAMSRLNVSGATKYKTLTTCVCEKQCQVCNLYAYRSFLLAANVIGVARIFVAGGGGCTLFLPENLINFF